MPDSGLLVFSGIDDVGSSDRGLEPDGTQYLQVLFAIRPEWGLIDNGWINRPEDKPPSTTVAWYRAVRSTDAARGIHRVRVQDAEPGDDVTRQVRVVVEFECANCQPAILLVDDQGVEDVAGRVLPDLAPGQLPVDLTPDGTLLIELPLATPDLPRGSRPPSSR
jgi:hypothetical protein